MKRQWLFLGLAGLLAACQNQPDRMFTVSLPDSSVLVLTDALESCAGGARLAFITNGSSNRRGCWVRKQGDIRASFADVGELRVPSWQFQPTELSGYRNMTLDAFAEARLYEPGR